jgi:hypothetical protein
MMGLFDLILGASNCNFNAKLILIYAQAHLGLLHFASPLAKQNEKQNKNISPLSWEKRLH